MPCLIHAEHRFQVKECPRVSIAAHRLRVLLLGNLPFPQFIFPFYLFNLLVLIASGLSLIITPATCYTRKI